MKKKFYLKNSFTIFELMIVIVIISIVSFLTITNFRVNSEKEFKVNLSNVKKFMLEQFDFNNELNLTCIKNETLDCYIFIDKNYNKKIKIKGLFKNIPDIYNYNYELTNYKFNNILLEDEEYDIYFELIIDYDKKHKNIIVDTNQNEVYLFSSITNNTKIYKSTNEIIDEIIDSENEVKYAF